MRPYIFSKTKAKKKSILFLIDYFYSILSENFKKGGEQKGGYFHEGQTTAKNKTKAIIYHPNVTRSCHIYFFF